MPPSRTHKNIARGRRFSISSRSRASSLGSSAALNASAKNSAFTDGGAASRGDRSEVGELRAESFPQIVPCTLGDPAQVAERSAGLGGDLGQVVRPEDDKRDHREN